MKTKIGMATDHSNLTVSNILNFKMISFYTNYWLENRAVLLDGEFHPFAPLNNYPMLEGTSDTKKITTLYADLVVDLPLEKFEEIDILNAKRSSRIVVATTGNARSFELVIRDCLGGVAQKKTLELDEGTHSFEVPPSGLISLKAI